MLYMKILRKIIYTIVLHLELDNYENPIKINNEKLFFNYKIHYFFKDGDESYISKNYI